MFEKLKETDLSLGKKVAIVLAIVLSVLVLFTGCGSSKTIDLSAYVVVHFTGVDGYGKSRWSFDLAKFEEDYGESLKYKKNTKENAESVVTPCILVSSVFKGDVDIKDGLSNGDSVTFTWFEADEKYLNDVFNHKFEFNPVTFTVAGLDEIEMFDAFEGIEVVPFDYEPCAEARIENHSDNKFLKKLDYDLDKEAGLSNGDTVIVTIESPMSKYTVEEYCLNNYGKLPMSTSKEYTIEGLGRYVDSVDEIPEHVFEKMHRMVYEEFIDQGDTFFNRHCEVDSFDYIGEYILTCKDKANRLDGNRLYLIYKVKMYENFSEFGIEDYVEYYYYGYFDDVVVKADGSCPYESEYTSADVTRNAIEREVNAPSGVRDTTVFKYIGFETLEEMYEHRIEKDLEYYDCVSTVGEKEESILEYVK